MDGSSGHDLFQHRYYRFGKILMSLIGQWPYQRIRVRRCIFAVLILFSTSHIVALTLALVKHRQDCDILLECLMPNVLNAVCAAKYVGFMWNQQKTLKLLSRIRTNWQVWAQDPGVNILHAYAQLGEKITIVYPAVIYGSTFVFMIQPMITKLIDVGMKNDTEPGKFPFPIVYYHLDVQKYYFYLIMYCTVCALLIMTALVASDIMLIIYVQHVCSIFAAVGDKLERIGNMGKSTETEETRMRFDRRALGETDMLYIVSCIDRHNDAIECADLIKTSYAWNFFFTLGFGMILINASGLQVLLRTNDLGKTLAFMDNVLNMILYFYIENYISQILTDHSLSIRFCIQNSQWYRISIKAQKLLQLMTMRCNVPCQLTIGNMLAMSVQTFWSSMKTAASYFAFVRSMRGV